MSKDDATATAESTDVEVSRVREIIGAENAAALWDDDSLAAIGSFSDAMAAAQAEGVQDISDFGTGFTVLDTQDKVQLIGVPFLLLDCRFNNGDNGDFVSIALITEDNRKLIINDGSTGICKQLAGIVKRRGEQGVTHPQSNLWVKGGLSVSEYDYTDDEGKVKRAKTFYVVV